jgi:hypothetical protein
VSTNSITEQIAGRLAACDGTVAPIAQAGGG